MWKLRQGLLNNQKRHGQRTYKQMTNQFKFNGSRRLNLASLSAQCRRPLSTSFHPMHSNGSPLSSIPIHFQSHRLFTNGNLPDHEVIGMPALSPSVERSKIVEWKKKVGEMIEEDEAIAVVETDKAQLDWKVTDEVYLAKILVDEGVEVDVNHPVCVWVFDEKDVPAFANFSLDSSGGAAPAAAAAAASESPKVAETKSSPPSSSPAASSVPSNLPDYEIHGMPALSPTATEGALVEWLVEEGGFVEEGTEIAQIQTDKSTVAWQAIDDGYLAKRLVPASDSMIPVNGPIAVFVMDEGDLAAFKSIDPSVFLSDNAPPAAGAASSETASPAPSQPDEMATRGRIPSIKFTHGVRDTPPSPSSSSGGRVFASPYARKLASEMKIDLNAIGNGSGPRGRIVASDVESAAKSGTAKLGAPKGTPSTKEKSAKPSTSPPVMTGDRSFEDIPVSTMRQIIAKRLSESKFSSPHYYETIEIEIDSLMEMRRQMNEDGSVKISVNDFIVKACAHALRDVPAVNVSWFGDKMRKYNYVDISVAVATPSGLITPIVTDADQRGLASISSTVKDLANRAKDNKLLPEEFQGGTFTISNLGMFGVKHFTAIINPPQACILAVGGANQVCKPDSKDPRGFKVVSTMAVTLSSDHRAVDGAVAAQWLASFRNYMENPAKLML